jgi:UDP-N-acetylmuramoyl-tripeptide--D-alanyl-D-alanine ligase
VTAFWNPDAVRAALGGAWVARPPVPGPPGAPPLAGVSTDSRAIRPGQVFVAIRGDTHDGHAFLRDAVERGASMLVIDEAAALPAAGLGRPVAVVRVPETRRALLRLAAAYRQTLTATRVIAVAGSNGKTTAKRLIDAVLSVRLRGTCSPKSFNNDIGVPLTILAASPADQYLLCEIGTNAPGEVHALAQAVQPDVAVITSIGREHLEGLGSLEGVAREEASLLAHLRPGGVAIVTADSPHLAEHLRPVANVVTFGRAAHADLRLSAVEHAPSPGGGGPHLGALRFAVNGRATYTLPLIGEHNALNALAAIAVGRRMGLADEQIADALAAASPAEMRMERLSIRGIDLINDAYNANPESMLAALRTLVAVGPAAARRVAVLGDMLELGAAAPDAHREIGRAILELDDAARAGGGAGINLVVIVGHLGLFIAERLSAGAVSPCPASDGASAPSAPDRSRAWPADRYTLVSDLDDGRAASVAALLKPGDLVLLKGSRRMRLERIVEALREPPDGPSPPRRPSRRAPARR